LLVKNIDQDLRSKPHYSLTTLLNSDESPIETTT
jgi:hypothetical protein